MVDSRRKLSIKSEGHFELELPDSIEDTPQRIMIWYIFNITNALLHGLCLCDWPGALRDDKRIMTIKETLTQDAGSRRNHKYKSSAFYGVCRLKKLNEPKPMNQVAYSFWRRCRWQQLGASPGFAWEPGFQILRRILPTATQPTKSA